MDWQNTHALMDKHVIFRKRLLKWSEGIERDLPWKEGRNPYFIWLSEIILQQTRVAQGRPYYLKFIKAFPKIEDLAKASQDEVFSLWEGLGYYSRARNLHASAKQVVEDFSGEFPNQYEDIRSLKGVGPYTAAAIASFAFDLAYPVVDGNVMRVLTRVFGIEDAIDSTSGKKKINALAEELLDKKAPAAYNQAIMDFGALQCTPKNPNCSTCPLGDICISKDTELVQLLPYKAKKVKKRNRYFHYFDLMDAKGQTILSRREDKDIWQGLYQFPMVEKSDVEVLDLETIQSSMDLDLKRLVLERISKIYKQTLSHQYIHAIFYKIRVEGCFFEDKEGIYLADRQNVSNFAFPKLIREYIEDKVLTLF